MRLNYQGFDLDFLEHTERWRLDQTDFASLKEAKAHCDQILSEGRKIPNIPVIIFGWRGERTYATATRWEGNCIWVKNAQGKRSKHTMDKVAPLTTPAEEVLKQADALRVRAAALFDEAEDLLASIPRLQP